MLRLISKICPKISFSNLSSHLNNEKTNYNYFKSVFKNFYSLNWYQIYSHVPMAYYQYYYIKNPNFQHQLKLPFLNMKYYIVIIITLVHICIFGPIHLVQSNTNTLSLMILAFSLMKSSMDYIFPTKSTLASSLFFKTMTNLLKFSTPNLHLHGLVNMTSTMLKIHQVSICEHGIPRI